MQSIAAAFDIAGRFDVSGWDGAPLQGVFNFRSDPTVLQVAAWCLNVAVELPLFIRPTSSKAVVARSKIERVTNVSCERAIWLSVIGVGPPPPDR